MEPSAGTGRLLHAILHGPAERLDFEAVEINAGLAARLEARGLPCRCADFLECNGNLGTFDRIVMNPPFQNAADVAHIRHAFDLLKPGGRLVAVCANGPRQREAFRATAAEWIDLEPGTFLESGTGVNAALVVLEVPV